MGTEWGWKKVTKKDCVQYSEAIPHIFQRQKCGQISRLRDKPLMGTEQDWKKNNNK